MELRLAGRNVLVTGAGRGLGRTVAEHLAAEGAAVALAGTSLDLLEEARDELVAAGGRGVVVALDVRDDASVRAAVATAEAALGPLDGLVANSGVPGPTAPLWEVGTAAWEETLAVNLTGVFRCCREVLGGMVARRSGSVVVVGSVTGKRPLLGRSPYAAAKLGLVGLVRTAALDAAAYGVRVNLVSPGPVDGDRLRHVVAAQAATAGVDEAEALRRLVAPALRPVAGGEVARAVAYLLSEDASGTTGEDLNVSAGAVGH